MQKIVVDLCEQLQHESAEKDKYRSLLRELLEAQRNRKSEQLSKEQLALFEAAWQARSAEGESAAALRACQAASNSANCSFDSCSLLRLRCAPSSSRSRL